MPDQLTLELCWKVSCHDGLRQSVSLSVAKRTVSSCQHGCNNVKLCIVMAVWYKYIPNLVQTCQIVLVHMYVICFSAS